MVNKQIRQKYSARHLTPAGQNLSSKAVKILCQQLTVLKAINMREGYPRTAWPRIRTSDPTFLRSGCGGKILSIH